MRPHFGHTGKYCLRLKADVCPGGSLLQIVPRQPILNSLNALERTGSTAAKLTTCQGDDVRRAAALPL